MLDIAQIAAEYILVVVVAQLHHQVTLPERVTATVQCQPRSVQCRLQSHIQIGCAYNAFLYGSDQLYVAHLLTVCFGQMVLFQKSLSFHSFALKLNTGLITASIVTVSWISRMISVAGL